MQLGDRKKRILQAVIQDYIETAEPVGSRSISKKYMQDLSSATIRNEMADLEEMGYLQQPHTSAGRIPSDLGYRIFVDSMLQKYDLTIREMMQMQEAIGRKIQEANKIAAEVSSVLAHLTNYAAVSMIRPRSSTVIQTVQLMYLDALRTVVIVVTSGGAVKNRLIAVRSETNPQFVITVSQMLGKMLSGLAFRNITDEKINDIKTSIGFSHELIDSILDFVRELAQEAEKNQVVIDGSINLLNLPEYSDINKARHLLEFINDKNTLSSLAALSSPQNDIQVYIGQENPLDEFKECSVIFCNYNINNTSGSIGVVGPKRMDYAKTVSMLEFLKSQLDRLLDE